MSKTNVMASFGIVVIISALIQCNIARAANFTVGDAGGWTFNVAGWENGKTFNAGDVLAFNYPSGVHTVVLVSKANFDSCTASGTTFTSGSDKVTLQKGQNFFICGKPNHCSSFGMKIAVNAA